MTPADLGNNLENTQNQPLLSHPPKAPHAKVLKLPIRTPPPIYNKRPYPLFLKGQKISKKFLKNLRPTLSVRIASMRRSRETDQLAQNIVTDPNAYLNLTEFKYPRANGTQISALDPSNNYELNNISLRGPDASSADILAIGCSQTFGLGVQERETWPAVLSELTGMSYVNLAAPGISPQSIVNSAILYVRDYGKPKYICANLPSLYRFTMPTKSDIFVYKDSSDQSASPESDVIDMNVLPARSEAGYAQEWPTYSKKPHKVVEVLPYEVPLYLSMMALNHLIEFCRVADITLYFTTWYSETAYVLSEKKNRPGSLDMSGYVPLENMDEFSSIGSPLLNCHLDHQRTDSWFFGTDRSRHIGVHQHLHYAEMFAAQINSKN